MKYEKAEAEVILFDNSDVVTTSTEALGKDEWNWGEIDDEFGCDGSTGHVVKDF